MKIFYTSLTGKTKRFVGKTGFESELLTPTTKVTEPFILVVYTFNFGQIPDGVREFLYNENNYEYMRGVASSGHPNWGDEMYGRAAKLISNEFRVPNILRFRQSGTEEDVEYFINAVNEIDMNEKKKEGLSHNG